MGTPIEIANGWKGGQARLFYQEYAGAPLQFMGCAQLDGLSQDLGEPEPVYCPSTLVRGQWDTVDTVDRTPALPTGDLTVRADRYMNDVWWDLRVRKCRFKLHLVVSDCAKPDDYNSWDARLMMDGTKITTFGLDGAQNPLSGDDNNPVNLTLPLVMRQFYNVRSMGFSEFADATVLAEILDGTYYDTAQCGSCGTPSDGSNRLYFLAAANTGSPGLSSQIVYTLNGGSTWATLDIPVFAGQSANRIAAIGSRLLVFSQNYGGYAWSEFDDINAGTVAWTGVTSGFVAGKAPRAVYTKSMFETYIAGAGGYIYLLSNPGDAPSRTLTDGSVSSQNLNDIDGYDNVVVAVGGSNAVLVSTNGGDTFSLVVGPTVGINLTSIAVLNRNLWYVGTGNGRLYRTRDSGTTWTQVTLNTSITVVNDIRFYDENVGYMAVEIGGAGRVYRTVDGGFTWDYSRNIKGAPTSQRVNVVVPNFYNQNLVAIGGRKTVGGDGLIAIAS